MNKKEQEQMQKAFQRAFNTGNRRWQFNGRAFETTMDIYRGNVYMQAKFESSPSCVTVRVYIGRVFHKVLAVSSPPVSFCGENAMTDALNYLAERYIEMIDKVKEFEEDAVRQLAPDVSADTLLDIFSPADQETA